MKVASRIPSILLVWRVFVSSNPTGAPVQFTMPILTTPSPTQSRTTRSPTKQSRATISPTLSRSPSPSPQTRNPSQGLHTPKPESPSPSSTNVTPHDSTTIFYIHGDVPYTDTQAVTMELQMGTVPNDAEFVVFVGDLRASGPTCVRSDYERASNILKLSRAPVFALIGDNDWTDCPNRDEGLSLWNEYFLNFDTHWNHKFNVQRQTGRPENFSFQNKGSLFIGLNIVGGLPRSAYVDEWNARLTDEVNWSMDLIRSYKSSTTGTGRIVIFGHANPNSSHDPFFIPLAAFIQNELQNKIPIMYINGDQHMWVYTTNFYNQVSFQRITVTGLGVDPLLKVNVVADGQFLPTDQAITYDRRLSSTFRS